MDHTTNPILCCLEPSERAVVNDEKTMAMARRSSSSQPPEAPMDYDGTTATTTTLRLSGPPMDNDESPMKSSGSTTNHVDMMMMMMDDQPYDVMAGMAETSASMTTGDGGTTNGVITESANVGASDKSGASANNNALARQDFHTPEFRQRLQEARAEKGSTGDGYSMDPQDYDAAALQYDDNHLRTPEEDLVLQQELAARQAKVDKELQDEQEYKQDQDVVAAAAAAAAAATTAGGAATTKKDNKSKSKTSNKSTRGTILEAAFVDPAYSWPPVEGEGKNAIELQASLDLLEGDTISVGTTESMRQRMTTPTRPVIVGNNKRWWQCCKAPRDEAALEQVRDYEARKVAAKEARKAYAQLKKEKRKSKETALKKKQRYNRVPEGILIYRLDTSQQLLSLMSPPAQKTNLDLLVKEMTIASAKPSPDKSRRGIVLQGADGQEITLVACEQRTATAWLEAMQIMLAKEDAVQSSFGASFARVRVDHLYIVVACLLSFFSVY
jgi:hypothetical protein